MIVLIADVVKPRALKIAYALERKGFNVNLICAKNPSNSKMLIDKSYMKVFYYSTLDEAMVLIKSFSPLVYHIFEEAIITPLAEWVIRNKKNIGKIVFDSYDIYRDFVEIDYSGNASLIQRERFCLEHADGLCCRSLETQYLKKIYKYHFPKRLLFFDYCWGNRDFDGERDELNQFTIVYGGRIIHPSSGSRGSDEWKSIHALAEGMASKGGMFCMIPSRENSRWEQGLFHTLELEYPGFRYLSPMPSNELIDFESQCDYGIDCLETQNSNHTQLKMINIKTRYYATNKYFDYIDAGIPVIYGRKGEYFGQYFKHNGVGVYCPTDKIADNIEQLKGNKKRLINNMEKARREMDINNQISRLIRFYYSLQ